MEYSLYAKEYRRARNFEFGNLERVSAQQMTCSQVIMAYGKTYLREILHNKAITHVAKKPRDS